MRPVPSWQVVQEDSPQEVWPRNLPAIKDAAKSIVITHNHSWADPLLARDLILTKRLESVGRTVGIQASCPQHGGAQRGDERTGTWTMTSRKRTTGTEATQLSPSGMRLRSPPCYRPFTPTTPPVSFRCMASTKNCIPTRKWKSSTTNGECLQRFHFQTGSLL